MCQVFNLIHMPRYLYQRQIRNTTLCTGIGSGNKLFRLDWMNDTYRQYIFIISLHNVYKTMLRNYFTNTIVYLIKRTYQYEIHPKFPNNYKKYKYVDFYSFLLVLKMKYDRLNWYFASLIPTVIFRFHTINKSYKLIQNF